MTVECDEAGLHFADLCQKAGFAGFAIRTTDTGDVRLICLSLPAKVVADLLRTAAEIYERDSEPETFN